MNITPQQFIDKCFPYAIQVEEKTGIPAVAVLAQSALESSWGKKAIGNNIFGIKFRKGDWKSQTVLTTEYDKSPHAFRGCNIKSVKYDSDRKAYKYKIWGYFADYPSPYEAFLAHSQLLLSDRYIHCMRWKNSPKRFLIAVWRAGYATGTDYGRTMCDMVDSVNRRL